jgi:hypothetical protein
MTDPAARAAAVWAALSASHDVADHWVQIDAQAVAKGQPGSEGVKACAAHVATYTATQAAALYAANRSSICASTGVALPSASRSQRVPTTSPTGKAATGATPNRAASSSWLPPPDTQAGSNATPGPAT